MELNHPFLVRSHDIVELLQDCELMSTFCTRLERQSKMFPNRYDPDKYKGDGLELFTEALIKLSPVDNRIGIANYSVITESDVGADGVGIGANGHPATVQVKYRGNSESLLTANVDHLSNFIVASQNRYGVPLDNAQNMLVITTAKDLHPFTRDEMMHGKVRCIGYQQLRELVDNNGNFWNAFRALCGVE